MSILKRRNYSITLGMLCLYTFWGTPFLARKFAIETIPPFLMEGVRFASAGAAVMLYMTSFRKVRIEAGHWKSSFIIGGLLLLGGNGGVVWAQQEVPSGIAALFIAMVPLWIVLIDWLWKKASAPSLAVAAALVSGFSGIVFLVSPRFSSGSLNLSPLPSAVLLFSAFSWALGSIYAKYASLHKNLPTAIGMQMFAGGILLIGAGFIRGEFLSFNLSGVSLRSILSLLYLIVFASILGFNVYIWLLKTIPPAQVATYAYVNPIVAISLGWKFAGEEITSKMLFSALLVIFSVAVIVRSSPRIKEKNPEPLETP